jgi:hypothetical protein
MIAAAIEVHKDKGSGLLEDEFSRNDAGQLAGGFG